MFSVHLLIWAAIGAALASLRQVTFAPTRRFARVAMAGVVGAWLGGALTLVFGGEVFGPAPLVGAFAGAIVSLAALELVAYRARRT